MTVKDFEAKYFDCSCMSPEHTVRFVVMLDNEVPERSDLNLEIQLNHYLPWYRRIVPAIKFLFGWRDLQNEYDTVVFKREDVVRLKEFLQSFEETVSAVSKV